MNGLPIELVVILCGIGAVALGWLLLRFGKVLARVALVAGGLTLALIVGAALLTQASATKEAATAAKVASAGQATTSVGAMLCAGSLGTLALAGASAAGVFYVRWKLTDRRQSRLEDAPAARLPSYRRPRRREQRPPEVVYIVEETEPVDDLDLWGWGQ